MYYSATSRLSMVEENEAIPEVAAIYDQIKRDLQTPFVPNMMKAIALSPAALAISWDLFHSFFKYMTLPESLMAMMHFTIAEKGNCQYCSASSELTCRTLGIDEETLAALVEDLGNVSPQRVQAIIEFALKVAQNPQGLVAEDYERVRQQGISDEELVEIIIIAAVGVYSDIIADALKVEVDSVVAQALGR